MRLDRLAVHRLPGIPDGFTVEATTGVNIVIGPNGSGKSSLARAIRSLFWPSVATGAPFSVEAHFTAEDGLAWKAAREDGRPRRWWLDGQEHPPPQAPGDFLRHCYEMGVLDLVLPAGGTVEVALAGVINREISGGVDLVAIADDLFPERKRTATTRRRRWQEAHRDLEQLLGRQHRLAQEEKELSDLRRQGAAGRQAAEQLPWWRNLVKQREVRDLLARLEARQQAFPAGQDRVRREDPAILEGLQKDLGQARTEVVGLVSRLEDRQIQLTELNWPGSDLGTMEERVEALAELIREEESIASSLAQARARLDQARRDLDPTAPILPEGPLPTHEVHDQLARAYSRLMEKKGLREGLDTLLSLPEWEEEDAGEALESRRRLLRGLLAPGPAADPVSLGAGWAAALAASIAGVWLVSRPATAGGWLLLAGGVVCGTVLAWRTLQLRQKHESRQRRRREIHAELRQQGLPLTGQENFLELLLLSEELATEQAASEARRRLRSVLTGRRESLAEEARTAAEERDRLRRDHGLGMEASDPELLNLLLALPRFREARDEVGALEADAARLAGRRTAILENLAEDCALFGEAAPAGLPEARSTLQRLEQRELQHREHRAQLKELENSKREAEREVNRLTGEIEDFWDRRGLPVDTAREELHRLVSGMDAWEELRDQVAGQRAILAELDTSLALAPDHLDTGAAMSMNDDALAARLQQIEEQAIEAEKLATHIALVEQRVESARRDHRLADAAAEESAAREELADARRRMQEGALGRLLLEDVEASHQRATRPRVLQRAARIFRDFTGDLYDLRVIPGPARQGLFVAHDLQLGENLGLGALSDGTRAQLLLAVRLAFITENEEGVAPPLFLDESLSSSDPGRFAAIAGNLARWAREHERQIFYLTSQPNDAEAWQATMRRENQDEAHIIDLAARRDLASSAQHPLPVVLEEGPPPPGASTAAEYARRLRVPALDPWRPATAAHLWYLLFDDLDLLHRLLVAATPTLGAFLARRTQLSVLADLAEVDAAHLAGRGAALTAFLSAWKIGRGRPLLGHDLERSGHISDRYLPECLDLLATVGGDAELFLAGLRSKKVKGFRRAGIEALGEFLDLEGFLATGSPLAGEDLLARVQSQVLPEVRTGALTTKEARSLVETWRRALQSEKSAGATTDRSS